MIYGTLMRLALQWVSVQSLKVITAAERSERPRTVIQGNCEWVTIVECIGSSGCHTPPLIILKGKEHQAT